MYAFVTDFYKFTQPPKRCPRPFFGPPPTPQPTSVDEIRYRTDQKGNRLTVNAVRHRREVHLRPIGVHPPESAVDDPALDVDRVGGLVGVEEAAAFASVSDDLIQKVLKSKFLVIFLAFDVSYHKLP